MSVSLSPRRKRTLTHPNNEKDKVEESEEGKNNNATVTETFSFAKRAFIFTTIFQMGWAANCTSIEKKRSKYVQPVPGESWSNHLYIKLHFLQITIDIQK